MKFIGYVFMALVGSSPFMTDIAAMPMELSNHQMVCLADLTEEALSEFVQGNWGDLIIECPKDLCLPLQMTITGEFLAQESMDSAPCLKILKTCYVRCEKEGEFLFSSDLENWAELFDFFTGEMGAVLSIEEGRPSVKVYLELNQR